MRRFAIHSVPRSGSTWLGSIIDAHPNIVYKFQPLFSYAFKGQLKKTSSKADIVNFFDSIAKSNDDFIDRKIEKEDNSYPNFIKGEKKAVLYKEVRYHYLIENLLKEDSGLKMIGLIRDPRAVLFSWWNAPKEFNKNEGWFFEEEWKHASKKNLNRKEEYNGYLKWKEVATLFLFLQEKFPSQFYLVKYSNLLIDTEQEIKEIMNFFDFGLHDQQKSFIIDSRTKNNSDAYSVFKEKKNDDKWKQGLPKAISEYIQIDLTLTKLEVFLDS